MKIISRKKENFHSQDVRKGEIPSEKMETNETVFQFRFALSARPSMFSNIHSPGQAGGSFPDIIFRFFLIF